MNPQFWYAVCFFVLAILVILLDHFYGMLRTPNTAVNKPYSYSKVQLAWWTVIIIAAFAAILLVACDVPVFDQSTIILLGISAATTTASKVIGLSDQSNPKVNPANLNLESDNFILDILSDENGVTVHRLQALLFNFIFGIWFILKVWNNIALLPSGKLDASHIIPIMDPNNLLLIGISSGTYAAMRATENKTPSPPTTPAPSTTSTSPSATTTPTTTAPTGG